MLVLEMPGMIAVLPALLGAAITCTPVPGADQLWQPTTRWVIVGEMHGTNETPDAFANLVCLAAATGRPVTVALEYSADDQATIDAYLASSGDAQSRATLLSLPLFTSEMQDGCQAPCKTGPVATNRTGPPS